MDGSLQPARLGDRHREPRHRYCLRLVDGPRASGVRSVFGWLSPAVQSDSPPRSTPGRRDDSCCVQHSDRRDDPDMAGSRKGRASARRRRARSATHTRRPGPRARWIRQPDAVHHEPWSAARARSARDHATPHAAWPRLHTHSRARAREADHGRDSGRLLGCERHRLCSRTKTGVRLGSLDHARVPGR
jgi:hypothetical protein